MLRWIHCVRAENFESLILLVSSTAMTGAMTNVASFWLAREWAALRCALPSRIPMLVSGRPTPEGIT